MAPITDAPAVFLTRAEDALDHDFGACAVIIRSCQAICPERQERLPVTADPVSDAFTELIWWLATRPELPTLLGEHTEDVGGTCAGCARHGMLRRRWPCAVHDTLGIAAALQTSELFTTVTGRSVPR